MPEGFAQNFIAGMQAGQAHKQRKKQQEWDDEDRGIEKDILAHRIKELKIQERIQARQAAQQNLEAVQGTPEEDIPLGTGPGQGEGMPPNIASMLGQPPNPVQMNPMDIPGIEELGVPGVQRRPQTMEQVLAANAIAARMKAMNEPYTLPEGATRNVGDTVIARGTPKPVRTVTTTTRDAAGRTTTRRVPETEAVGKDFIQEPLPRQANQQISPEQEDDAVAGIMSGDTPADIVPRTTVGVRMAGKLHKLGFNLRTAQNDLRALRAHFATINTGERSNILEAADAAESALSDLASLNDEWAAGGFGTWNSARLALAKKGLMGTGEKATTAQKLAVDLEGALKAARSSIAQVAKGGTGSVNTALADAAEMLGSDFSSSRMKASIDRVRTNLGYRTNSIRNAKPILPSEAGAGGAGGGGGNTKTAPGAGAGAAPTAAQVAKALDAKGKVHDDATVKKVMANPAMMEALFPK